MKWLRLFLPVLAFGLIFGLAGLMGPGCSGRQVNENDPNSLLSDAEADIKSDHYQIAIDKLRALKNKFPYSNVAVTAQLRIADVYFLQENFAEAAGSYETFRDLHPKHEKVPYALFRIAKSHFNDIPSPISRDLTPATKALSAYEDFLAKFPFAPDAQEAHQDLSKARALLAEKELYVANFYFKRDIFDSAKSRFTKILELYPDTTASKEAKEKLESIARIPLQTQKND